MKGHAHGLRITNKIFTDATGQTLRHWDVIEKAEGVDEDGAALSKTWRRGFWSGERPWETSGPKAGQINELVRRHLAQKHLEPPVRPEPADEMETLLTRAAARLQGAATKKRRQATALRVSSDKLPSSSSSSSSSNSSYSSSERESWPYRVKLNLTMLTCVYILADAGIVCAVRA